MSQIKNELDIGFPVPGWKPCNAPPKSVMTGRYCQVEPIDVDKHSKQLHAANLEDSDGKNWTYLGVDAFTQESDYRHWIETFCLGSDPLFHAIVCDGKAVGVASLMRIKPDMGVVEVGNINYSPLLQKTTAATEAMYLMMCRVFDELGYRRYEWKCDSLNAASRKAAERLGFQYEGTFRQALVYKGRNRDTAWYAMTDKDWPDIKAAFQRWLDPQNFEGGRQKERLDTRR